jgi:mono/diheme cytochrome c family protein
MKNIIYLFFAILLFSLFNCNKKRKETKKGVTKTTEATQSVSNKKTYNTVGYDLMKQNCFVCHMETPNPSKRGRMIAPPMLRVIEHYKPNYSDKDAFVKAIINWVKKPSEDKVMMPGAVLKFNA